MKYLFGFFYRSTGAAADVKELEYISAIHQSSSELNPDGTITAEDVRIFLRSRYGVVVSRDDAIDIVNGLSGKARLPLPVPESKYGLFRRKKNDEDDDETALRANLGAIAEEDTNIDISSSQSESRHRRRRLLHNPLRRDPLGAAASINTVSLDDDEDEPMEDAEHHWGLLAKAGNMRKNWHFKRDAPKKKKTSQKVEKLVKYDLVELLSVLLIPTLVRMERFRFAPPIPERKLHVPRLTGSFWQLSGLSWHVFKLPYVWFHEWRRKRLVAMKAALRPQPDTLIDDVLRIMLGSLQDEDDVGQQHLRRLMDTGSVTTMGSYFPKANHIPISEALVRELLIANGENQASRDADLVRKMVDLVGGEGSILDERSFVHAMTADVGTWPIECEDDVSTSFFDVYGFNEIECAKKAETITPGQLAKPATKEDAWAPSTFDEHRFILSRSNDNFMNDSFHSAVSHVDESARSLTPVSDTSSVGALDTLEGGLNPEPKRGGKIPGYKMTASFIDYGADTFQSITFVVFLFSFYVMASIYIVQLMSSIGVQSKFSCTEKSFECVLVETIWSWLSFAVTLSLGGLVIIVPISVGNNQFMRSIRPAIFSTVFLTLYTFVPWIEVFLVDGIGLEVSEEWNSQRSSAYFKLVLATFTVAAGAVQLLLLTNIAAVLTPRFLVRRYAILQAMFMPSNVLRTANQKRAATNKINLMITNAHKLHRRAHKKTRGANAGHATILGFVLYGEKIVECGGFLWAWKGLFTRSLLSQEGVWIHARLVVGQLGQVLLAAIFGVAWWYGIEKAADAAESERQNAIERDDYSTEWVLYLIPTKDDLYYSLYPSGVIVFVILFVLLCVYFPSTASTVLKFRSGFFPSLHDPTFKKYRGATDMVYYNTGNMIYAFAGSAAMLYLIFGGLLFLCFWEPTAQFMLYVIAWGIGLTVTILLKTIVTALCRSRNIKAFFRTRPGAANIASLALECWHIGLGSGVLLGRLTQFLLAAAFWIGRIDSHFLSEDVEVFGYRFDTVPHKFTSEILVHEAHRHPHIERMAALYLMRLKYGEHFCNDAGAAWRRLFVSTLFPWMLKYRAGYDDDGDDESEVGETDDFPLEENPTPAGPIKRMQELPFPGTKKKPEQPEARVEIEGMDAVCRQRHWALDPNEFESTRAVNTDFQREDSMEFME